MIRQGLAARSGPRLTPLPPLHTYRQNPTDRRSVAWAAVAALVLNELVFWVFRAQLNLNVFVSQLLAIACVLPFNFIVNKLWSFRGR